MLRGFLLCCCFWFFFRFLGRGRRVVGFLFIGVIFFFSIISWFVRFFKYVYGFRFEIKGRGKLEVDYFCVIIFNY